MEDDEVCYYDTEEVTTSAKVETSDDTEEATTRTSKPKTRCAKGEIDEPQTLGPRKRAIANNGSSNNSINK